MNEAETRAMIAKIVFGGTERLDELEALGVVPLESRVVQMETGGDTVARAAIDAHATGHPAPGAPQRVRTYKIEAPGLSVTED